MPTVSELKAQARNLEQQGETPKALSIYLHVLRHLEGTPAIHKEIALYVKSGDLHLKLGQNEEAIRSYENAANHYAEHGSAQRVTALCTKIRRVAPHRRKIHVTYAKRLMEHNHAGSARDVLAEFAAEAGLDKTLDALEQLAGRSNDEVRPMLEILVEYIDKEETGDRAEEGAERVSARLMEVTDAAAGNVEDAPHEIEEQIPDRVDPARPHRNTVAGHLGESMAGQRRDSSEPMTPPMVDLGFGAHETDEDDPDVSDPEHDLITQGQTDSMGRDQPVRPSGQNTLDPDTLGDVADPEADPTDDLIVVPGPSTYTDITAFTPPPELSRPSEPVESAPNPKTDPVDHSGPRRIQPAAPVPPRATQPPDRGIVSSSIVPGPPRAQPTTGSYRTASPPHYPGRRPHEVAPVLVRRRQQNEQLPWRYVAAGVGVVAVIGLGFAVFRGGGDVEPPTVAAADSTVSRPPSATRPTLDPVTADSIALARMSAESLIGVMDSLTRTRDSSGFLPVAPLSVEDSTRAVSTDPLSADADSLPAAEVLIRIDGLAIQSVTPSVFRGQEGFRVVHGLGDSTEITVESYAVTPDDTTVTQEIGRTIVRVTPPDTTVGIVRMDRHIVFVSAPIPEDSLRTLLARLVQRSSLQNEMP